MFGEGLDPWHLYLAGSPPGKVWRSSFGRAGGWVRRTKAYSMELGGDGGGR